MSKRQHNPIPGDGARLAGRGAPRAGRPVPRPMRPEPAQPYEEIPTEELFGRQPFTSGREPRYFGTGVPGYTDGPGFTGGYYGYGQGDGPEIPTELEREYAHEVYGEGSGAVDSGGAGPGASPAGRPPRTRRYPPGPKGYQRSDERIREDICERLMRHHHIDSSEVTVEVRDAKVALEGTVPDRRMKHAIEDLADACLGVKDVENRIRVSAPPTRA